MLLVQTQAENAGAQEISRLIGAGLEARGCTVRHLFFYSRTGGAKDLGTVEICAAERPRNVLALVRLLLGLRARVARFQPDVVLTFQHWGNVVAAPLCRLASPAPVIANQVSPAAVTPPVSRVLDRLWGTLGVYRVISTNSAETERYYADHPSAYRRRLVAVPYGFELKRSPLGRHEARRRFALPEHVTLLGCAARLNPVKRLDAAIRMLSVARGYHLALAGQGPAGDDLKALARSLGVSDRVHFIGELEPTEIGHFLAALDVFVFPTSGETFGLSGVEAAASGVPVVAADLQVLREVLRSDGDPAALFTDVTDPAAFAQSVDRVVTDGPLRQALQSAGRGLIRRYALETMVDAYAGLVEQALGEVRT